MDENLKHVVSTACRPGLFRIALFEGFPNIPYIPPPPLPDTQWAQIRQQWHRPRKTLRVGIIPTVPERYVAKRPYLDIAKSLFQTPMVAICAQ